MTIFFYVNKFMNHGFFDNNSENKILLWYNDFLNVKNDIVEPLRLTGWQTHDFSFQMAVGGRDEQSHVYAGEIIQMWPNKLVTVQKHIFWSGNAIGHQISKNKFKICACLFAYMNHWQ